MIVALARAAHHAVHSHQSTQTNAIYVHVVSDVGPDIISPSPSLSSCNRGLCDPGFMFHVARQTANTCGPLQEFPRLWQRS